MYNRFYTNICKKNRQIFILDSNTEILRKRNYPLLARMILEYLCTPYFRSLFAPCVCNDISLYV